MTSAEAAIRPTHHPHPHNHNPINDEMVAPIFSTSKTPPESPRRAHRSFSVTGFNISVSPTKKSPKHMSNNNSKSPKTNRRASYHAPEHSPTRLTMGMGDSSSARNLSVSPLPPSSRPMPSNAAAPVVGHHQKSSSLIGFDPLLNGSSPKPASTTTTTTTPKDTRQFPLPVTPKTTRETTTSSAVNTPLANLALSPPTPPKPEAEMKTELSKIAKDLSVASPHRPTPTSNGNSGSHSAKVSKAKFGRAASLTPKFNLTPPFRASITSSMPVKEPQSTPHRKLPWQRHRRSKSLETPDAVLSQTDSSLENDATKANANGSNNNHNNNGELVPSSPMMRDLFDVVKAQENTTSSLALPSLAKPAPTSFLTGTEIVRSSEQDPSPFQMEIPSLDQTLVAARLVQFVEHYRKEDMNMDLSMSLVGLNRLAMSSFVEAADTSAAPPNLTQAHRPVVESLLEAADDVTVAGFFATENAGSADVRREAVILERQMQFVIVFRGTTQEQVGKAGFFKKNHAKPKYQVPMEPLVMDGTDSKVFAPLKAAYMDLEHRVFDCLDRLLDSNPFCDVIFTGSSWGGAMATLGAYRYASNRPMVRVSCQTFGAPKVGNKVFKQQVNSLPNLKVMRVEHPSDAKCVAPPHDNGNGAPAGHAIVLSKSSESNSSLTAVACRFDGGKHHSTKPAAALFKGFKKDRDISSYVGHLEQLSKANKWMKDFAGEDGTGVRGKDNEQRQMV